MEGIWTDLADTTCPPIVARATSQLPENAFATGVSLRTDHKHALSDKIKTAFEDNRGATDLKMMCSNGAELQSTAALLGKHK